MHVVSYFIHEVTQWRPQCTVNLRSECTAKYLNLRSYVRVDTGMSKPQGFQPDRPLLCLATLHELV